MSNRDCGWIPIFALNIAGSFALLILAIRDGRPGAAASDLAVTLLGVLMLTVVCIDEERGDHREPKGEVTGG